MLSNYSLHNKQVVDLTYQNHLNYCAKWNIDLIYTTSKYSPHNNFDELINLFNLYDIIITVGTDIFFTSINKNILDFNDPNKLIVIQDEGTGSINGDFIIFNKIPNYLTFFNTIKEVDKSFNTTQDTFKSLKDMIFIKILPIRSLQSICPFGNEQNKNIQSLLWQPNDFSVHCHRPRMLS